TPEVPERTIVDRIPASKLTIEETMFLIRVRGVLIDDYLMSDVDAEFATISHGVAFHVEVTPSAVQIAISRELPAVRMVVECYRSARDVLRDSSRILCASTSIPTSAIMCPRLR